MEASKRELDALQPVLADNDAQARLSFLAVLVHRNAHKY
jgi:hypothetical protein